MSSFDPARSDGRLADAVCYDSRAAHVSKKYVDKSTSKKVRKSAAPFIVWLDEQESDDEDEDEDEESDVDVDDI